MSQLDDLLSTETSYLFVSKLIIQINVVKLIIQTVNVVNF